LAVKINGNRVAQQKNYFNKIFKRNCTNSTRDGLIYGFFQYIGIGQNG